MATPAATVRIDVVGVNATVQAIKAFDPVMYRRMTAAAKKAVAPIASEASGRSPRRTGQMAGSWQVKKARSNARNGRTFGYVVINSTRQGAILEFAGKRSQGHTPQGASLIRNLTGRFGQPGRFAWQAYDARHGEIDAEFLAAVRSAEAEMQAKLEAI